MGASTISDLQFITSSSPFPPLLQHLGLAPHVYFPHFHFPLSNSLCRTFCAFLTFSAVPALSLRWHSFKLQKFSRGSCCVSSVWWCWSLLRVLALWPRF